MEGHITKGGLLMKMVTTAAIAAVVLGLAAGVHAQGRGQLNGHSNGRGGGRGNQSENPPNSKPVRQVPEPAVLTLMAVGVGAAVLRSRRRAREARSVDSVTAASV
jgi:hypothetical protein